MRTANVLRRFLPGLALCLAMACAAAQPAGPRFDIQRFTIAGSPILSQAEADEVLAPFTGPQRTFEDVQRAADAVAAALRRRGYNLARVVVPQQDVTAGVVRLQVLVPTVGKVTVEGNAAFSAENVRRSVPALKEGAVLDERAVARNLQLAAEHPAKQTTLLLRPGGGDEVVDVGLRVEEQPASRVFLTLDNTGNGATGYYRAGLGYQSANLFGRDHVLTAQAITSPGHASKVSIYGLGYRIPFYRQNGSLDLVVGYSDVNSGVVQGLFNVAGSGAIGALRWNWILPRWGATEQKLSLGLDYRAFRNEVTLQGQNLVPDITIHPLSLTYAGVRRGAAHELSFHADLSANLPGGHDGRAADFERARAGADHRYVVIRYGASYQRQLKGDWQLRVAAGGQHTGDALVAGEQYGIGGADTVRGYEPRELASDRGYSAQLELHTPELAGRVGLPDGHRLRLLAFLDGGAVQRNRVLPGEFISDAIGSVGIGLRWSVGRRASLRLDLAHVLQPTANREKGSNRLGAALVVSF